MRALRVSGSKVSFRFRVKLRGACVIPSICFIKGALENQVLYYIVSSSEPYYNKPLTLSP